jgi:hypothetical protein
MSDDGGFFSADRNTNETAWDVVGALPGVGEIVDGVNLVGHLSAALDGDHEAGRDAAQDALGLIPGLHEGLSIGRLAYDAIAGNDNSHDLIDRFLGGEAKQNPDEFQDDHPPAPGDGQCVDPRAGMYD